MADSCRDVNGCLWQRAFSSWDWITQTFADDGMTPFMTLKTTELEQNSHWPNKNKSLYHLKMSIQSGHKWEYYSITKYMQGMTIRSYFFRIFLAASVHWREAVENMRELAEKKDSIRVGLGENQHGWGWHNFGSDPVQKVSINIHETFLAVCPKDWQHLRTVA